MEALELEDGKSSTKNRGFNSEKGARTYDRYTKLLPNGKEERLWKDVLSRTKGKRVLDLGVGTGFLSGIALQLGLEVVGLDMSSAMLDKAGKNLGRYGDRFTPMVGDAENVELGDGTFDIVMSRFVLWTLPHPGKMLEETARLLKPDGTLLLSDGTFDRKGSLMDNVGDALHLILDMVIGWNWPDWDKEYQRTCSSFPLLPRDKVFLELKSMGAREIRTYDLTAYQSLIYRAIAPYWRPYLMVVKFK